MSTVAETLDQLAAEMWEDTATFHTLKLADPKYTYTKRQCGGWEAYFNGLHLGWAVQDYDTKLWTFYTMQPDSVQGRRVDWGCRTRSDAVQAFVMAVTNTRWSGHERYELERYYEVRAAEARRFEELMAR